MSRPSVRHCSKRAHPQDVHRVDDVTAKLTLPTLCSKASALNLAQANPGETAAALDRWVNTELYFDLGFHREISVSSLEYILVYSLIVLT